MDLDEMKFMEARLPFGQKEMPSPEEMERLKVKMRQDRNNRIAASLVALVRKLWSFAEEARRIAVACTAARLHQKIA